MHQNHIENSYGYVVFTKDLNFFYSGDTYTIDDYALSLFLDGALDLFYHEVAMKQSTFHTGIETLNNLIPFDKRNNVILMHFENDEAIKLALDNGYDVANQ